MEALHDEDDDDDDDDDDGDDESLTSEFSRIGRNNIFNHKHVFPSGSRDGVVA